MRSTNFSDLFLELARTCFGQYLCPSSGLWHCTHSNGHQSYRLCWLLISNGMLATPDDGQRYCPKHVETNSKNSIWEISASHWFYYNNKMLV